VVFLSYLNHGFGSKAGRCEPDWYDPDLAKAFLAK